MTGPEETAIPLPLADIQGIILRDYDMPVVRHFLLGIENADSGRRFIGSLVNATASSLRITTAEVQPGVTPDYCLNIGFTYEGLKALHLPPSSLESFSSAESFVAGAAARANAIGDIGNSAPQRWKGHLGTSDVHVLLSLYAQDKNTLATRARALAEQFQRNALTLLQHEDGEELHDPYHDEKELPGKLIHFGYRDGISQPAIAGAPPPQFPSAAPVSAGAFLLGYPSQWTGFSYPVPRPPKLGRNGSFAVFRVFQQDVVGFEQHLEDTARATGMDKEEIAAKICGRWRNGTPLVLSPQGRSAVSFAQMNQFDYSSDRDGTTCPFGAHMRRTNPRGDMVAGGHGDKHPIIRRAMPYGPWYDPKTQGDDGIERGLLGLFICVSIEDQFEFLVINWINGSGFRPELPTGIPDPLIGKATPGQERFLIPTKGNPVSIKGFSQFVTTRGCAYCFLPSITGLKYMASLSPA
jgi:Dyp-type peroxidase family